MSDHEKKKREREERRRTSDEKQEALRRQFAEAHAKRRVTGDGTRPMQPQNQPWIELPNGERLYTDVLPEDASAYEAADTGDVIGYADFDGFEDDVYGPNHRRRGETWDIPGT